MQLFKLRYKVVIQNDQLHFGVRYFVLAHLALLGVRAEGLVIHHVIKELVFSRVLAAHKHVPHLLYIRYLRLSLLQLQYVLENLRFDLHKFSEVALNNFLFWIKILRCKNQIDHRDENKQHHSSCYNMQIPPTTSVGHPDATSNASYRDDAPRVAHSY